jgi:hypothetical protein
MDVGQLCFILCNRYRSILDSSDRFVQQIMVLPQVAMCAGPRKPKARMT